ncbi:hypothetical protein FQN55_000912 [Onygenales sp. PD_40]|nr:hypothetical protein FQN55_000912 [Onygenales sp. PD_40]KAK2780685.1 hypothetical protein FQN52_002104 [Onygenales sp. PD_12]
MILYSHRWLARCRLRLLALSTVLLCAFSWMIYTAYDDGLFLRSSAPPAELASPPSRDVPLAIVLGKTRRESVGWVYKMLPDWIPFIYTVDNEPGFGLHVPANIGREAMVYLTFIIDHYDSLPDITAFLHSTHYQWHNEDVGYYNSAVLRKLRIDTVKARGYVNLRCKVEPGCPSSVHPHNPTEIDVRKNDVRAQFRDIYVELFNVSSVVDVPQVIGGMCCAQFAVSKERILERPLEDYVRMRRWMLGQGQELGGPGLSNFDVGWVFEKIWHVVFGEEAVL